MFEDPETVLSIPEVVMNSADGPGNNEDQDKENNNNNIQNENENITTTVEKEDDVVGEEKKMTKTKKPRSEKQLQALTVARETLSRKRKDAEIEDLVKVRRVQEEINTLLSDNAKLREELEESKEVESKPKKRKKKKKVTRKYVETSSDDDDSDDSDEEERIEKKKKKTPKAVAPPKTVVPSNLVLRSLGF